MKKETGKEKEILDTGIVAIDQLITFIERLERLEAEKTALEIHIEEVCNEANSAGFDIDAIRQLIESRTQGMVAFLEPRDVLGLYKQALLGAKKAV